VASSDLGRQIAARASDLFAHNGRSESYLAALAAMPAGGARVKMKNGTGFVRMYCVLYCVGSYMPNGAEVYGPMSKQVEIGPHGLPRIGDKFACEGRSERAIFEVNDIVWEEGRPVKVLVKPLGVAATSVGKDVLEQCGWSRV